MSNPNESEQNSHLAIVPLANHQEEPIEAEILEETSIEKKRRRSKRNKSDKLPASLGDRSVSIVPLTNHLILDGECIETAQRNDATPSKPKKAWQEIVTSPWTAASLIIVFAANIAIGVLQWKNASHQATQPTPQAAKLPKQPASSPPSSPSIDLTSEAPETLNLKTLSLIKPDTTAVAVQPVEVSPAPPPQVAQAAPSAPNLSQVLLPPSLQPQTAPTQQNVPSVAPTVVVPIPQVSSLPPPPILAPTETTKPSTQPPKNNKPLLETIPTLSEETNNPPSPNPQTIQPRRGKDDRSASTFYQRKRASSRSRSTPQNLEDLNQQLQNTQQQPDVSSQQGNTQPRIEIQPPVGSNTQPSAATQPSNTQPRIEIQPPVGSNTQPSGDNSSLSVEKKPDGSIEIRSKGLR